ncbi:cytochrome P450 [Pisolithus croceorrhizus]|nr:cytochrome P450 [Pisolithus croceorrhizus]
MKGTISRKVPFSFLLSHSHVDKVSCFSATGTIVLFNYWEMKAHGYDDPDRFDPTRHLTPDGQLSPEAKQNNSLFYGLGKRVCPGRFFADHSLWAATAVMMSSLKFGKAKDSSGKYVEVEPVFPNGLIRPKGLPIIGNALDIDPQRPHLTFAQWGKIHGDIVYARILGQDIIILNSEKTSRILAEGRSAIYSGRYRSPLFKIYGSDRMTPVLEYGNEWKTHRRLFHLSLHNDVVDKYDDLHLNYAHQLFRNILDDSTKLFEHVDLYAGAILVQLIYGQPVEGKDDPIFAMANGLAELMSREMTVDRISLLKVMPLLQYLPSWFPGAGFKPKAGQCKEMVAKMAELPFAMAKDEMATTRCTLQNPLFTTVDSCVPPLLQAYALLSVVLVAAIVVSSLTAFCVIPGMSPDGLMFW